MNSNYILFIKNHASTFLEFSGKKEKKEFTYKILHESFIIIHRSRSIKYFNKNKFKKRS
jgi:hypothetical protein